MTSELQDRPSHGIARADGVIPFPTPAGRKPVAVCRGAGVGDPAPVASRPAPAEIVQLVEVGLRRFARAGADRDEARKSAAFTLQSALVLYASLEGGRAAEALVGKVFGEVGHLPGPDAA